MFNQFFAIENIIKKRKSEIVTTEINNRREKCDIDKILTRGEISRADQK